MPKVSRFRNRKINFKTRIPIRTGVLDALEEDDFSQGADGVVVDTDNQDKDRMRVETGVDKEEESEVHLQNVISASAASYTSRASPSRGGAKPAAAFIPTPDATGHVADWEQLYRPRPSSEPVTFIRFSDTVEDTSGVAYNMDEEDEEWLEKFNADTLANADSNKAAAAQQERDARNSRQSPKKKSGPPTSALTELQFEMIMDHFEKVTEERLPLLRLDMSRFPTFADLEPTFSSSEYSQLSSLKIFAKIVYTHWKERRIKRGGKIITPQLDYDETEDNPYVCFRRRELKNVRKTRRTDSQNLERLARLNTDLTAARDLLVQVLERERLKREDFLAEQQVFEGRVQVRDLKRKLGEKDGDEDILIGRREKRRKTYDENVLAASTGSLKVPLRIPQANREHTIPATAPVADPIQPYKDRTQHINQRIERDLTKKREADREWDDFTDGAYLPPSLSAPARYWRAPESVPVMSTDGTRSELWAFGNAHVHAQGGVQPSFRKRIGRGGRILLDRSTSTTRVSMEEDPERRARLQSLWKFDTDTSELPGANSQQYIDDFDTPYMSNRLDLLRGGDSDSWQPSSLYLDEAIRWVSREPEKLPPTTVVGKLPVKPMPAPNMPNLPMQQQQQQMQHGQPQQAQQPPSSQGQNGMPMPNNQNAAVVGQMMAAANHAQQVAQTQAMARGSPNGTPMSLPQQMPNGGPALRRHGSISSLGPNNMPMNVPQQWPANIAAVKGLMGNQKMDAATLQNLQMHLAAQAQQNGGPHNQMQQQQLMNQAAMQLAAARQAQQMNGQHSSPMMHPANGLPMRMATPSFALPPPASSPMMMQQGLQRAPSVSSNHGSPSMAPAHLPTQSRPSSAMANNEALMNVNTRSPTKRSPRLQSQGSQQQQQPFPGNPPFSNGMPFPAPLQQQHA